MTKTPSVRNLEQFFRFFPDSPLIVIVRDGRGVVESGMRTFGWDFERAAVKWTKAAGAITRFARENEGRPFRIVRYEELHADPVGQLQQLLPFLGLPAAGYDFAKAKALPVRGSSELRADGSDAVATDGDPMEGSDLAFYLVRAENGCGAGSVGETSEGATRAGVECPGGP